jgi:hypothetical protein
MTRPLVRGGRFALLLLLLPVCFLPLIVSGQRTLRPVRSPRISDWSSRHVVYTQIGTSRALEAASRDPRANMRWQEMEQRDTLRRLNQFRSRSSSLALGFRNPIRRFPLRTSPSLHADWSISLGTGETALSMYPAKYSFDANATPNCTADFVVFPVDIGSANTQPNLVAFNNLYSGTAGATGICNSRTPPSGHTDTTTSATVLWSYNIHAINPTGNKAGGAVNTSPALSLDGTKVAFVESLAGATSHFHVLAWRAGDGQTTSLQTTTSALEITTFVTTPPAAGSGTVTDLSLGTAATGTNTLSSPFIDYFDDTAYVGNDIGVLYRIKNVFCTTAACKTTPTQPALDGSWGTGGAVTTGCGGVLTGAVVDFTSTNVFVGCSNGKLYKITQAGVVTSITVGNGSTHGGIVDPPLVDGVNGFVYAVSGSNGTNSVLVQTKTDFSSTVTVALSSTANFNLHAPVVNDAYYDSTNSANWLIYEMAYNTNRNAYELYGVGFNSSYVMSNAASHTFTFASGAGELSPTAEFLNANSGVDWLFSSTTGNFNPNLGSWIITPTASNPSGFPSGQTTIVAPNEGTGGTSGFIVDNDSTAAQASSIYFSAVSLNTAVKLTQAGLQ